MPRTKDTPRRRGKTFQRGPPPGSKENPIELSDDEETPTGSEVEVEVPESWNTPYALTI